MSEDDSGPAASDPGAALPDAGPAEALRYERRGLLGQGGMGRVYAAQDHRLRRQVAYKVAATPALAGRLAREAWITAQLEHPGIIAVYDAGETDGQAWYTMRLHRGRTLRERIGACADLPARMALLPHLHAACQAVAYAHAMGIVHRDLKPSNILVGEFGETQVADWGLAGPLKEAAPDWARIVAGDGAEEVAGTARYMSPEQARGAPASRASDVFCLGAALYELLSGTPPPDAPGVPPDLDGLPAEVPRALVAIMRRCLRVDPAARYPSAAELADDLGRWFDGRRVYAYEYPPIELFTRLVRAWRAPLVVGALAAVVLAAVVALSVARNRSERAVAEVNFGEALTQQALTALRDDRLPEANVLAAHALRLGPSAEASGVLTATARTNADLVRELPLPPRCRHTGVLSADTRSIACYGDGKLEVWELDPLIRRASVDLNVVEEPVWVGQRLVAATPEAIVWIEGGAVVSSTEGPLWRPMAEDDVAFAIRGAEARRLWPDGHVDAFTVCDATRATTQVVGRSLVIGCDDGFLRSYGPDGAVGVTIPIEGRPAWSALGRVDGGLLVGWFDGSVQTLGLSDGRWGARLPGRARLVRGFQPVPGSALRLVLGDAGGPRIWDPEAAAWVGSLPARASRMFPAAAAGQVWLLGEALQLWQVAAAAPPSTLHFGAGISQVSLSPAGDAVAVALGSGDVVERGLADGRERRRWRWADGVVKGVAYGEGGRLLGAAMRVGCQILGPGSEVRPLSSPVILRRVGRLWDGRVWGLPYTGEAMIIDLERDTVVSQPTGLSPFDGSSSLDGRTAAVLDANGGVWVLEGSVWRAKARVNDAVAVDVGDGGYPLVIARQRKVCVGAICAVIGDDVVEVSVSKAQVAVGTKGGDIWLLDSASGAVLARLKGHTGRVSSLEFAADGATLVSGGWDGTVRLWDLDELLLPADVLIARAQRRWGLGLEQALRSQ